MGDCCITKYYVRKIISIKSLEIHDFCQSCEIGFFLTELYVDIYFLARLKKKEKEFFFFTSRVGLRRAGIINQ